MRPQVLNLERLDVEEDSVGDSLLSGEYFTGIAFDEDATTGVVLGLIGYRFGKRHGATRGWDRSGRPTDELYRNEGTYHGPSRKWHSNGQLAEFEYYEHFIMTRSKSWDENGRLVQEYTLRDAATIAKLEEARRQKARPIVDIDLKTLTFFQRPEGWGRSEVDLPPPQAAPSLELCRALEAQTLTRR